MSELPSITEWSEKNQITDQREQTLGYGEFLTKHYMEAGTLDSHTYNTIQRYMFADLTREQGIPTEEALQLMAPKRLTLEEKAKVVSQSQLLSVEDERFDVVSEFVAAMSVKNSEGERSPYFEDTYNAARAAAEGAVNSLYNDAARKLVADGVTPFARLEQEDGTIKIRGGDAALGLSALEAYEKSKASGAVTASDLFAIYNGAQTDEQGTPAFRMANFAEATAAIQNAMKDENSELGARISRLAEETAGITPAQASLRGESSVAMELALLDIAKSIPEAAYIPQQDLKKALELAAGNAAMKSGLVEFDSENVANNIRRFGYGQVVLHRDLIASKTLFNEALKSLPEDERKQVADSRELMLKQQFPDYDEVFNNTYVADDWQETLTKGLAAGKKKHEILDEFLSTYDYSAFRNEVVGHIGASIGDAFTDIIHGVRAMSGSEQGRKALLQNMEERQARERLANMFGGDIGMAVDLGAMVAPVLVDVGATALLGATTAGTGALAWQGTKAGLRGLTRALMRDVVATTARETAEDVATKGVLQGALRSTAAKDMTGEVVGETAEQLSAHTFSQKYATLMANKYFTSSAVAVPAFTRSASMTYASVYSALENTPEGKAMTAEERHDKALGAGLTAGAITATITTAFQLVGRGGLEAFIGRGATAKQVRRALEELGGKDFASNQEFAEAVGQVMSAGWKKVMARGRLLNSPTLANFTDEALEEGMDEFLNTFVQAYATNEDIRFTDLITNTGTAAFYGGIFGAGMPAMQRVTSKLMGRGVDFEAIQQQEAEAAVDQAIVEQLEAAGSPMAAQEVARIRRAAPRKVAADAQPAADAAAQPAAADADADAQPALTAEREAETIQERLNQIAQQGATTTALQAERADLTARLDELNAAATTKASEEYDQILQRLAELEQEFGPRDNPLDDLKTAAEGGEAKPARALTTEEQQLLQRKAELSAALGLDPNPDLSQAPKDLTGATDQEFEQMVQTELLDAEEGRTPTRGLSETRAAILQRVRKMEQQILAENPDFATIEDWRAAESVEGAVYPQENYLRRMEKLLERVETQMLAEMRAQQEPTTPPPAATPAKKQPNIIESSQDRTEEEEQEIIRELEEAGFDVTEEPLLTPEQEAEIALNAAQIGDDPEQAVLDARRAAAKARSELISANPDEGGSDPFAEDDALPPAPDEEAIIASEAAQRGEDPEAAVAAFREAAAKKRASDKPDTPAKPTKARATSTKQAQQPLSLAPISYVQNPSYNEETSQTEYSDGEAQIVEVGGRAIVLVNINGIQMPFYLSTGKAGKKDVKAGKWYPIFGIGSDGWLNKGSQADINNFYGSPVLKQIAAQLDAQIGKPAEGSVTKVSPRAVQDSVNRGLKSLGVTPAENQTSTTLQQVTNNITTVLSALPASLDTPAKPTKARVTSTKQAKKDLIPPPTESQADLDSRMNDHLQMLVDVGFPVVLSKRYHYGAPTGFTRVTGGLEALSAELLKMIQFRYPATDNAGTLATFPDWERKILKEAGTRKVKGFRSWTDPITGQQYTKKDTVEFLYSPYTGVAFDNNPVTMAAAMRANYGPISIPAGFDKSKLNPAFVLNATEDMIIDVEALDPEKPPARKSMVSDGATPRLPEFTMIGQKLLHFLSQFDPPANVKANFRNVQLLTRKAYLELQELLGMEEGTISKKEAEAAFSEDINTEGSILDGSYTYAEAIAVLDQFFNGVYPHAVEGRGSTEYASVGSAIRRLLNIDRSGLRQGSLESQDAAAIAMGEVYAEVARSMKVRFLVSHIFGNQLATDTKGEYQITADHIAEVETFFKDSALQDGELTPVLLGTAASSQLPMETKRQRVAVAILNAQWQTKKILESITQPDSKPKKPVEGWENTVIETFLRDSLADPAIMGNSQQAIDLIPSLRRARNRVVQAARDTQRQIKLQGRDGDASFDEMKGSAEAAETTAAAEPEALTDDAPAVPHSPLQTAAEVQGATVLAKNIADRGLQTIQAFDKRSKEYKRMQAALAGVVAAPSGGVITQPERAVNFLLQVQGDPPPALVNAVQAVQNDIPLEVLQLLHLRGYPTKRSLQSPEGAKIDRIAGASNLAAYAASSAKDAQLARTRNNQEVQELGLVDGDPSTVLAALQKIAATSTSPTNRLTAKLLLANPALIQSLDFRIIDQPMLNASGLFAPDGNAVVINVALLADGGVEAILLHEYMHAATHELINRPADQLSPAQRTALKRLNAILEQARQSYQSNYVNKGRRNLELEHGLRNLDEMIAMTFSSPSFQQLLQQKHQSNYFVRFVRALKALFRIPESSALDEAFDALIDLTNDPAMHGRTSGIGQVEQGIDRAHAELQRRAVPEEVANGLRAKTFTDRFIESRDSSFEPLYSTKPATLEEQQMLDLLITDAVNLAVPNDIPVRVVNDASEQPEVFAARPNAAVTAAVVEIDGVKQTVVYINRANFRAALHERANVIKSPLQALHIAEAVLAEEVAHVAEFHTLPTAEVDALARQMSDIEFDQIIDSYTENEQLRADLKRKVRQGDGRVKRQMVGEFLRMKVQRITRGYTSEEDIRFYSDRPSMVSMFKRHLTRVFRRMYAKFKLRSENAEMARIINKMARELHLLQNGRLKARRLSFDPTNPDETFRVMEQRFSALLADVTEETPEEAIQARFGSMFDVLEFPVGLFEQGKYTPSSFSWMTGRLDKRIRELKKFEEMFGRMVNSFTQARVNTVMDLRKKFPAITDSQIQAVLGRSDAIDVDEEFISKAEARYRMNRESVRAEIREGTLPPEAGNEVADAAAYEQWVEKPIAQERARLLEEFVKERDTTLDFIRGQSPELAQALVDLRDTVDALSIKMKSVYGLDGELAATVKANIGIYVTRSYRAFTEEGYVEQMLSETQRTPAMQEAYDAVFPFFLEKYKELYIKTLQQEDTSRRVEGTADSTTPRLTRKEAERQTDLHLKNTNYAPIHEAMAAYLHDLTGGYGKYRLEAGVTKALLDNLKKREDLPQAFRAFLGEQSEETALTNIVRTIGTLTRMTGRQTFFNNLIQLGHDPNGTNGFLLTHAELTRRVGDEADLKNWVNIRTGRSFQKDATETGRRILESKEDRTFLYYAPKEMVDDMEAQFRTPVLDEDKAKHQRLIDMGANAARLVTGVALTSKTLFSAGFYVRNIVGNLGFFQLGQGMINYKYTIKEMYGQLKRGVPFTGDAQATDAIRAELIGLGIVGGDISSNLLRDILHKGFTIEDAQRELEAKAAEFDNLTEVSKDALSKAKGVSKAAMGRLLALSEAVDSFYKIGYFMHELQVLRDAAAADPNGRYGQMDEQTLKRAAAQKVRETSQSYQDAPEFIRAVSQRFGFLLAPFLRFRTDIIRIAFNTVKLGAQESRDSNPVIRSRGIKRLIGFAGIYGGVGMLGSVGLRMLLGIGEDEDELYRQTVPKYKQDNTFFFIRGKDGVLTAYDLTYVNPMSPISDPILRAAEQIARGNPSRGMAMLVSGIWSEYTDTQIFTQAVLDVKSNKDARTGKAIYDPRGGVEEIFNIMGYIYREAYEPRTFKAIKDITKSAMSGPLPDPSKSPLSLLINEFLPTRGYRIDPDRMFQRYLENKRDERNAARSSINILKSRTLVTDGEVRDAMTNYIETSRNIDAEIRRSIIAAQKFGLAPEQALRVMSNRDLGMGKRRQANIIRGVADRPPLRPDFVEDVLKKTKEVGLRRLLIAREVWESFPPLLLLTDE